MAASSGGDGFEVEFFEVGGADGGAGEFVDEAAGAHHADAGGVFLGAEEIVRGHENGDAARGEFFEQGAELVGGGGVEAARGFVEEERFRALGERDRKPVPPLNLVGDFGGGGMFLAFGVVCGILEARSSGKGQVVDAAMVEGAAMLGNIFNSFRAINELSPKRGDNALDGGAHFYDTYETADGKWVSIGSIEPQFYALLLQKTGITDPDFQSQMDRSKWPALKTKIAAVLKSKTRAEWDTLMEGTDVCYAPVLSLSEAPHHPHNKARETFVELDGVVQPAPAPRFSRTVPKVQGPAPEAGQHNDQILSDWGFAASDIAALKSSGAI